MKEQIDKICKKKIKQQELVDVVQDIQAETEKRGAVKFGQKAAELFDIEEDSDSDELSIDEDSEEDGEEDDLQHLHITQRLKYILRNYVNEWLQRAGSFCFISFVEFITHPFIVF